MDVLINTLIQYVSEILCIIVIAGLGLFGSWLLSKLKQKQNLINISNAVEQLMEAATLTVYSLQQQFVDDWKNAQNGKLTEEQIEELKRKAIEITIKNMSEPTLNLLESAKIDVVNMITTAVESTVHNTKI
mgnify:CR=1 FL=1